MTFREFIELDRTDEPQLSDEQFRAILVMAAAWFEAQSTKRRRKGGGRRRGRPAAPIEPAFEVAPDFDLAEELH